MRLRDEKEEVHAAIWRHHMPYTIIDVGYWHQISFPRLPSGRVDYAMVAPDAKMFAGGDAPTMLTDKRDIGHFVARIIQDERTLNKRVFTHSDTLSQNEIWKIMEEKSGEKVETTQITTEEIYTQLNEARAQTGEDDSSRRPTIKLDYIVSKYVRADNTPEMAKYLGYIDARVLYPDFKPISFSEFVDELLAGKAHRPYAGRL